MSKKVFWKDNTTPPTNHIWCKTDGEGNVLGVYEHNGDTWVPIQRPSTGDGVPVTNIPNQVYVTDEYGNQVTIDYSVSAIPNTIAIRSDKGNLKTGLPVDSDDCIPLSLFSWIDV